MWFSADENLFMQDVFKDEVLLSLTSSVFQHVGPN